MGEHLHRDIKLCTLPCSVGFPSSQLTSVNNFQLVPIDSAAAPPPLLLMSETDESQRKHEKAGTELLQMSTEQSGCPSWSLASVWCPESLEVHWGHTGFLVSILNIYIGTEEELRVYYVFNGKSSSSSFFYCIIFLGFIFHSSISIAKLKLA